jgi:two-component system, LytTR family, response regulator
MTSTLLRTILVDDETPGLESMQRLLELNCPDVEVIASANTADKAIEKIKKLQPDLIFLDIAMPGKNGFDLLREMNDGKMEVIFVTAHNEFMIEAFHFSAIDYLLKPVDEDLLIDAVKRARTRIVEKSGNKNIDTLLYNVQQKQTPKNMRLCIPSLKGFQVVELDEILYAEASNNYTNFHFINKKIICTAKSLFEYEELLADAGFVRIHKSFLVNLLHVKEYIRGEGGSVILSDGNTIEVSRRKKDLLMTKMKEFYKY